MDARMWVVALLSSVLALVAGSASAQDDIDVFMAKVLERREQNRITLHDYVLDERETFELVGPGRLTLQSFEREFTWYVREGYLIRSPVRFDGVEIDELRRRKFEADWLRQEKRRDVRRQRQKRPLSSRSILDDVELSVERLWGSKVGRELARAIAADARLWGDDFAAIVAASDLILADLGGVSTVGFGRTVERVRDGFVMLEPERLDREEVSRMLSQVIPQLTEVAQSASDAEHARLLDLLELTVKFALPLPAVIDALARAHSVSAGSGQAARATALDRVHGSLVAGLSVADTGDVRADDIVPGLQPANTVALGLQPRFVSEAYFLDFEFEPGNYYLSGREEWVGREVVCIEYYPERLFSDDATVDEATEINDDIEAGFDKTSLVTLWIDPSEHQIVKYPFENVGFEFMPLRWLVRLDDLKASMVMSQPFEGIWLPEQVELTGKVTLATGSFDIVHLRAFSEYREAEVRARIRTYGQPQE